MASKGNEHSQLVQRFNDVAQTIGNLRMDDEQKRILLSMLEGAQSRLSQGITSQDIQPTIILLDIASQACKYAAAQESLAFTDELTGTLSLRAFNQVAEQTMAGTTRGDIGSAAVIIIDVVKFRDFNNNHGHDVGDLALTTIASTIQSSIRQSDVLGRIGGDEFAIIATHKDADHDFSAIRGHILRDFEDASIQHEGQQLPLRVSVGIADIEPNDTFEAAQKRADEDMYAHKEQQHNDLENHPEVFIPRPSQKTTLVPSNE